MRPFAREFARKLSLAVGIYCSAVSLTTFFTLINLTVVLIPIALVLLAGLAFLVSGRPLITRPSRTWMWLLLACLAYTVAVSAAYYVFADGASRVALVEGRYVAMYRGEILRTISEAEFQQFPNWWTRVSSAWIALGALTQSAVVPRA